MQITQDHSQLKTNKNSNTRPKSKLAPTVPKINLCFVEINFGKIQISALIDTGSSLTIMDWQTFETLREETKSIVSISESSASALSASGEQVVFIQKACIHFKLGHLSWDFDFQVSRDFPLPVVLGADFLVKSRAMVNMAKQTLTFPFGTPRVFALVADQEDEPTNNEPFSPQTHLSEAQKEAIKQLINDFPHTITKTLGRTNLLEYHIRVNSEKVVRARPYQYSPPKLAQMREHIDDLLKRKVIRPSNSQYSSPAFLVPKKGGKTRMVVDYRQINAILDLESTPMPTIESAFQHLGQARWFSTLDLNAAYNQIPLDEQSKKYTSFVVPWAQYEFEFLPFGLASGSFALTALMDKIMGDIKFKYVFAFFDDLCIYSNGSFEDHLLKVREVVTRLQKAGLTINPDKITIAANHIQFLGHMFSNQNVSIHPDRTRPIDQFPIPKNVKQLSRFLGMSAFYARFIKDYAEISKPLNQLKRKGAKFVWGTEQQTAFENIKAALVASPVLRMPDFSKPFVVHSDASGSAVGAVLSQEYDGQLLPVSFASRALNKHELNYATLELECLAAVFALQKFQQYLEHRPFRLYSDCSALTWLLKHPRQAGRIARWISFINNFQFTIHHIKGTENVVADCLSRLFDNSEPTIVASPKEEEAEPATMSLYGIPEAFRDIAQHQADDLEVSKIMKANRKPQGYSVQQGILMFKEPNQNKPRVVVPRKLYDMLFRYYHESASSAHLGIKKTLARISPFFWAKDLNAVIADKVKACVKCQRCKQAGTTRVGHLASEIVSRPWEKIFIDHVVLPRSTKGHKYILTVIDAFSKFVFFLPARNTRADTTNKLLKTHIFSIFGPPKFLVSDNVSNFRSKQMRELCMEYGIQHIYTSPYYPNPSHAERANKNIKVAIRIFHNQHQQSWDQHLHWFQIAFNSASHDSTKASPASLFLGRQINHPLELQWNLESLLNDANPQPLERRWENALTSLKRARQLREARYNQGRLPNTLKSGDWVMYRENHQSRAEDGVNQKLLPLWSKPCIIETFTSPVTVRLVDPVNGKFLRKAHVSQLKRFFVPKY